MSGIINQRMKQRIANGFVCGPGFNTRVNTLANGNEFRNKAQKYPKLRATADIGAFNEKDREELRNILYVTAGQWGAFRFLDPTDNVVSDELLITPIGTRTPVQLTKTYVFGPNEMVRKIQGAVSATVTMLNGVTPIPGIIDETKGLFTPNANWPATSASWSGQFDVWMRFTSDYTPITAVRLDLLTSSIELIEVYN